MSVYVGLDSLRDDINATTLDFAQDRQGRQIGGWPPTIVQLGPCFTTDGYTGRCTSFRQCYPYFKLPDLNTWETWVLGMYDTCTYFTPSGKQMFGVCCTVPVSKPPTESTTQAPEVPRPANPVPDNWPPPIPTHPPDHTAPTHPPGHPGHPAVVQPTPPTTTTTPKPPVYPGWPQWPPTTMATTTTSTTSTTTHRPALPLPPVVDQSCGAKNGYQDQERIVGGQNADLGEWPWIAALFNSGRQFCGGSLIDNNHILTAAHCVAHMSAWDVARLTVRLGDHNIKSNTETKHVEKKVKRVVRHRGFDSRTLYNDIAILTLDTPISYTKNIRSICLPTSSQNYAGLTATVIGWGSLRESGPQPSELQEVTIPIWTNRECRAKYGPAAPGGIVEHFLCAGEARRDSCSGDSGGPLMINEGRWTQVGIVSWGIGCGKGQYPGVYTRVTHFLSWINKNIKD
ncbi:trypsin-like isoform X2 [Rhodnius prolixus]|uniref:trypsin-like isoform X2 n=1 Tax=Rhodnius prolixus TaxID=13249 RepID=UPI003D189162